MQMRILISWKDMARIRTEPYEHHNQVNVKVVAGFRGIENSDDLAQACNVKIRDGCGRNETEASALEKNSQN